MNQFFTPVVLALLVINGAVFLVQQAFIVLPFLPDQAPLSWGAMMGLRVAHGEYYRLISSLFLHGNWAHLGLNMLALLSFGYTIEKAYGSLRFAVLYLLGGIVANLLFWVTSPLGASIGASGAVSTVLMLSAMKFPRQIVIFGFVPMPIRIFAVVYVILEMYGALGGRVDDGIAHFAHLGGLAFGYACFQLFDRKPSKRLPT